MLNPDMPAFANSVDPDQLAEEANCCGYALFVTINACIMVKLTLSSPDF